MQVEIAHAPASRSHGGRALYVCSDRFAAKFVDPTPATTESNPATAAATVLTGPSAKAPVCGMTVDPSATNHVADLDGQRYRLCPAGCRQQFLTDPAHFISLSRCR